MAKIEVSLISEELEINPKKYKVLVKEGRSNSQHLVVLSDEYYQRLTGGLRSREDLIKASFVFLLERQSKEKILPSFDLLQIQEFFPEFEHVIPSQD